MEELSVETFPLPKLGPVLRFLAQELHTGRGFFALSGLKSEKYSSETNVVLYAGLSSYIGGRRGQQDEHGNMLRTYSCH